MTWTTDRTNQININDEYIWKDNKYYPYYPSTPPTVTGIGDPYHVQQDPYTNQMNGMNNMIGQISDLLFSIQKRLDKIEERLSIIDESKLDKETLENYKNVQEAYDNFRMLEKLVSDKE